MWRRDYAKNQVASESAVAWPRAHGSLEKTSLSAPVPFLFAGQCNALGFLGFFSLLQQPFTKVVVFYLQR